MSINHRVSLLSSLFLPQFQMYTCQASNGHVVPALTKKVILDMNRKCPFRKAFNRMHGRSGVHILYNFCGHPAGAGSSRSAFRDFGAIVCVLDAGRNIFMEINVIKVLSFRRKDARPLGIYSSTSMHLWLCGRIQMVFRWLPGGSARYANRIVAPSGGTSSDGHNKMCHK